MQMLLVPVAVVMTSINSTMIWCLLVPAMVILLMLLSVFLFLKDHCSVGADLFEGTGVNVCSDG